MAERIRIHSTNPGFCQGSFSIPGFWNRMWKTEKRFFSVPPHTCFEASFLNDDHWYESACNFAMKNDKKEPAAEERSFLFRQMNGAEVKKISFSAMNFYQEQDIVRKDRAWTRDFSVSSWRSSSLSHGQTLDLGFWGAGQALTALWLTCFLHFFLALWHKENVLSKLECF